MALFGRKKKVEDKVEEKEVKTTKKVVKTEEKTTKAPAKKTSTKAKAKKEEKTESVPAVKAKADKAEATTGEKSAYGYRITEKATRLSEKNVYVLNVPKTINKTQLKFDLEKKYKVTVLDINISNTPKKDKFSRGKWGTRGGGKKAYITLKAGDSIVL